MKNKKFYLIGALVLGLLWFVYSVWFSPTRIATLNYPDFTVEKFIRSNNNPMVSIESVPMDSPEDILDYDMVLVRVHGASLDSTHLSAIEKAVAKGVAVYSTEVDNPKINSLEGQELMYIATLMENSSVRNNRSMFNYIRKHIDRKVVSNGQYSEPLIVPSDFYFHLGDDNYFSTLEEYEKYYKESGRYKPGAGRVVMLVGNINLQNSNEEHIAALINSLEARGLNVYPINSFGSRKLEMIRAVGPNLIINNPHGRLVMGGASEGEELLKQLGVPVLAPVTVSEVYEKWLRSSQGIEQGGLTSMSVVLPELDGAVAPFAVAAQFERNGYNIFDAIPGHTEKFCQIVENFINLQTKANRDKRVAIYFYKGVGKGAINAAELEGVQSLYNTLKFLRQSGYNVDGLPSSAKELEAMVQAQASVLGTYALGAYDEFLKSGNPQLVSTGQFAQWAEASLPSELVQSMELAHGKAPGDYMSYEDKDGGEYIAVARLQFGNVVILPQPMVSTGADVSTLIHGVQGAPAYPYVASYLWTRHGFGADALLHFGTHGSLEFIPGKQLALSDYDWTDALVGDMPHFYIYTINNIGEGIVAKRRSYATLVDHLTAPFMQGELYGDLQKLENLVHRFEQLEAGELKQEYRRTITGLARSQNICSALGLDADVLDDKDIEKIHGYLEEVDGAKVADGLYTLGEAYSPANANNTVRLMMQDPLRYSLATIDVAHGRIPSSKLDDLRYVADKYAHRADRIIARALRGESAEKIFSSVVSRADAQTLRGAQAAEKARTEAFKRMMSAAMASYESQSDSVRFLDDNGLIIETDSAIIAKKSSGGHPSWIPKGDGAKMPDSVKEMMGGDKKSDKKSEEKQAEAKPQSAMARMAQSRSHEDTEQSSQQQELVDALWNLESTISMVGQKRRELVESTTLEQNALLTALSGGYILPSSAGDPIVNPHSVSTGRNFYAINPETTPSKEAWRVGKRLAESLLEQEMEVNGKYPEKVSFTLWSSDFISSEGATVAQILWLLGVEPMRDGMGYIRSLRLVPSAQLGRDRIDVVVQTSGQLRDIAASRLALINRAITMAAEASDSDKYSNHVRKGFDDAERLLLAKGFSPADARKYSRERIFGGVGGSYGTGIQGMVEDSENWESQSEIAQQYLRNMSGMYSSNGAESWGEVREGVFEAALLNTSVVVQPRSSNTWGPLSLDHVYEFMGGLSAAVTEVTGNDPTSYFNDFRNSSRAKVQGLKESIGVETASTLFNPKYITEKLKGEASSYGGFAETVRNTFAWNALKPSAIDKYIWDEIHDVYVNDKHKLNLKDKFSDKNPYALQEITAVMLESSRKGMWDATPQQIAQLAELHTEMVVEHQAGCSGFVCDNAKLRDYIAKHAPQSAKEYQQTIKQAREVALDNQSAEKSLVLKKEEQTETTNNKRKGQNAQVEQSDNYTILFVVLGIVVLLVGFVVYRKRRA